MQCVIIFTCENLLLRQSILWIKFDEVVDVFKIRIIDILKLVVVIDVEVIFVACFYDIDLQ